MLQPRCMRYSVRMCHLLTDECEVAFNRLKECLTSAPILGMPRDEGTFLLDTDASDTGLGAVLSQMQDGNEVVIAYASRTLSRPERNYDVTRRELLAIVNGLKTFKQYLLGRHFVVRTDHAALQWLRKTPEPMGQQARWLTFIEQFHFEIQHRIGTKHGNADSLSRRPEDDEYHARVTRSEETDVKQRVSGVDLVNPNSTVQSQSEHSSAGESLADKQ